MQSTMSMLTKKIVLASGLTLVSSGVVAQPSCHQSENIVRWFADDLK